MTKTADVYNVPRGTAYITGQQVLLYIVYFIFYVFLARILGQTDVGLVGALALVQAVFSGLISGSLPLAATRFISRSIVSGDRESAAGVAHATLKMSLAIAIPGVVIASLVTPFLTGFLDGATNPTNLLIGTFIASIFLDLTLLYTAFFLGVGRYVQTLYQNSIYVPLSRGLGLALAYLGYGVFGIVIGWTFGAIAAVLFSIYLWHGQLPKPKPYPLGPILAFSLPVFISSLITLGQQWGDIGIIQVLLGPKTLAPYFLAVSSVNFLSILWMPVNQAIYPALSAGHSTGDLHEVSDRLATAFRLVNLTVLPVSAALAAISTTALDAVYPSSYTGAALAFSILSLSSIFVAQGVLLVTTLQAVGHTRQYLAVTLVSTLIFIGFVGATALPLGTLAGALGRALLSLMIVLLARRTLHREIATHINASISKALPLAAGVALPLFALDQIFLYYHPFRSVFQLVILVLVFILTYGGLSTMLRVFHHGDFAMLHDVLPRRLRPYLKVIQRIMLGGSQ